MGFAFTKIGCRIRDRVICNSNKKPVRPLAGADWRTGVT